MRRFALALLLLCPAMAYGESGWRAVAPLVPVVRTPELQPYVETAESLQSEFYHNAIVRVTAGSFGGSGTLIGVDDKRLGVVLTNHHVAEGGAPYKVYYHHGQPSSASLIASDPILDIAALWVAVPPGIEPIPLAEEPPQQGDEIQLCGYGGSRWKVLSGKVLGYTTHKSSNRDTLGVSPLSISGDSGGGILRVRDGKPELVAVLWGGPLASMNGPMTATHGTYCVPLRAWLEKHVCPRGYPYCIPPSRYPQQRPPVSQAPPQDYLPPTNRPPMAQTPPQKCPCDPKADAEKFAGLEKRIGALESNGASLAGVIDALKAMPQPKGCECDQEGLKAEIKQYIDQRVANIKLPEIPADDPSRHIVIVADQRASTWPRLKDDIERAQRSYSGIRIAAPPEFSVPLPQIVAYENGKPVKVIKGSRDVSSALSLVARGDLFFFEE